jgi:hypothetical protein
MEVIRVYQFKSIKHYSWPKESSVSQNSEVTENLGMNLKEISLRLKRDDLSDLELSALQMRLAGEYGIIILKLIGILEAKAEVMPRVINRWRTYDEAEKRWRLTEMGVEEQSLKLQMCLIEQQLQAVNTRLKMLAIKTLSSNGDEGSSIIQY